MNKEIYDALCVRLEREVPELRHIDWDNGQLEWSGERPPIDYPACLIGMDYVSCRDLTDREQLVTAGISLKLVFRPGGESKLLPGAVRGASAEADRERSLRHLGVIESVHRAVQGCTLGGMVSGMSRKSAVRGVRRDRLMVYTLTYDTTFQEVLGC